MLRYFRVILVSLSCLGLNACIAVITHGVGTVERSLGVGDDFGRWKAQMPAIPTGRGRIIVYPGGSRSVVFETTRIGLGGEQNFAVDNDVCTVLGNSFIFVDLTAGLHQISAGNMSELFGYRKGKNKLDINVMPSSLTYIRINKESGGLFSKNHYFPNLVAAPAAEMELRQFPIYINGLKCRVNKAQERKT